MMMVVVKSDGFFALAVVVVGFLSGFASSFSTGLTINPVQEEVVRLINQSYIVTCNGFQGEKVRWISPKGEVVADSKGRLHVENRPGMPDGAQALVFEHIVKTDKGRWSCHDDDRNFTRWFTMIVNEHISFVDTPNMQQAREDQEATVRCTARGDPAPTVSWYYNGNPLNASNKNYRITDKGLTIKKVSLEDKGNYTCRAYQISQSATDVMAEIITLNVQHKPIPRRPLEIHARAEMAYGYLSGTVNLTCEAIAEPAANFTWHSNKGPVSKSTGRIYEDTHVSVLTVHIKDQSAFGDYKCVAKNFIGTMERIITLTKGQRPKPPTDITLRGANSDILDIIINGIKAPEFTSIAPKADNLPIIGYRFQYMPLVTKSNIEMPKDENGDVTSNDINVVTSTTEQAEDLTEDMWEMAQVRDFANEDNANYLLENLSPDTRYAVRVMSKNAAGFSVPSLPKIYKTLILQPYSVHSGSCLISPYSFLSFSILSLVHFASFLVTRRRNLTVSIK